MKNLKFESVNDLFKFTESLFADTDFSLVLEGMANRLCLDFSVLQRYFGNSISNAYNHKLEKFESRLSILSIFLSIGQIFLMLLLVPVLSSAGNRPRKEVNCHVLVDGIQTNAELERWSALKKTLNNDIVFLTKSKNISVRDFEVFAWKQLYGYNVDGRFFMACRACFCAFVPLINLSFRYKINFFHLLLRLLNDFLYYSCIFAKIKGRYLIQDRNLGSTNAIKNFLFKKFGGTASCCVQKNIWQRSGTALYTDIDILFAIGKKTGELVLPFGSRLEKTYAVGSMSLQNALSGRENRKSVSEVLDVLFVGSNTATDLRRDWSANYEAIKWLVQLANEFPQMKFGIKHHKYSIPDSNEAMVTKGSRLIYVDSDFNSYTQALDSRIIVSYASTLIYEMIGIGKDAYFLDPRGENTFINSFVSNNHVIKSVEKLRDCLLACGLHGTSRVSHEHGSWYCIPHLDVVRDIFAVIGSESK